MHIHIYKTAKHSKTHSAKLPGSLAKDDPRFFFMHNSNQEFRMVKLKCSLISVLVYV